MSEGSRAWWRAALGKLGSVFLGAVLLFAAWAKAIHPDLFVEQIQFIGLDFLFPAQAVVYIALVIEAALGTLLFFGANRLWVLWPATALVLFFLYLTGYNYYLDAQGLLEEGVDCGCFGSLVQRTPAEAFWQDLALLVPPILLAFWGRRTESRPFPGLRAAAAGVLSLGVVWLASSAYQLPLDDYATRLAEGDQVTQICLGEGVSEVCLHDLLVGIEEGRHVVILTKLDTPGFLEALPRINEYAMKGEGPKLWIGSPATPEEVFTFTFTHGPAFEPREIPEPFMKPLYRTLPRTFLVKDGEVVETYSGIPPLKSLALESPVT